MRQASGMVGFQAHHSAWSFVLPSFLGMCHPQGASVAPRGSGFVVRSGELLVLTILVKTGVKPQ